MNDREGFTSPPDDARSLSAGGLTDDETFDDFLHWFGRYLYRRNPATLEQDPRFMNWLTRDLRRRPPAPDDLDPIRLRCMRQHILERVWAGRCAIENANTYPSARDVPGMPLAQSVDEASAAGCTAVTALAAAAGEGRELWNEECDRWLELPPHLIGGRYLALGVAGDSMTPLLHDGDTILVQLGSEIHPGTVVVARRADSDYVVKRVGRVRARGIELVSLNPAYEPITVRRDSNTVLGTVILRWCPHGGTARVKR
jgi:peptidase S24-like protein